MTENLFFISLRKFFIIFILILIASMAFSKNAFAGSGTFNNGLYDFCVSVRWNATQAQLDRISEVFKQGSHVFADATDNNQRFGSVHIVNNSGASQTAEFWIFPGNGTATATFGKYGYRGQHIYMYFLSDFQDANGPGGDEYTVAHEFAHHVFDLRDEYKGPSCTRAFPQCTKCAPTSEENTALSYCLMDNFKSRGGTFGSGTTYTLNEFCVSSNHDPDHDTNQQSVHGESCWQTIRDSKRPIPLPSGLPIDNQSPLPDPDIHEATGDLSVMLLFDRSGSMSTDNRLVFAKRGGNLFADFIRNGDKMGVSSFADSGAVNFSLTPVTGAGTRASIKAAINSLNASGSTNIGGGLLTALGQITSQPIRSCNEVIVLLSDGDHNVGTPPSAVIGQLQDAGVSVLTIGVGSGLSSSGEATLQNIASQTGGKYYRVSGSFSLVGVFLRLVMESIGNGLLSHEPLALQSLQITEVPVSIEPGATNATFALTYADSSDSINLSLRTPAGRIITQADSGTDPNVQFISGPNSKAFQILAPEAGTWTMIIDTGTINTGQLEAFAFADHDGVQLNASVTNDTVIAPNAIEIQASPTFDGRNISCATSARTGLLGDEFNSSLLRTRKGSCPTVTGTVTRPGGDAVPITLFDDGLSAHGDSEADDGVYTALFNNYQGQGTYTFDLTANVSNAIFYRGEILFETGPFVPTPVVPFIRSASTTAVVSGATATPSIVGVNPTQAGRGQTLNVAVTGQNTNFVNGSSSASFSGGGITVNSTTVSSPTSLTTNITIAQNAALTARDITITTGGEVVTSSDVFQIINSAPNCSAARPSVTLISPPNRSFTPVSVLGVTDPDNDAVSIAITSVRQDEPVDHIGDGSFVPDAVIGGSTAQIRAEAILGTVVVGGTTYVGNGRFYHIGFTATDTANSSCSGIVKVAVPHTRTGTPIDGGPLFNSLTSQSAVFSYFENGKTFDPSLSRPEGGSVLDLFGLGMRAGEFGLLRKKPVTTGLVRYGKPDLLIFGSRDWYSIWSRQSLYGESPLPNG